MLKLYFKKLFAVIAIIILFVPFLYLYSFVGLYIGSGAVSQTPEPILLILLYLAVVLCVIFTIRLNRQKSNFKIGYKKFLLEKFKTKDNIAILLAWLTLIIPLNIFVIIDNKTKFPIALIGILIVIISCAIIIEILNFAIWSLAFLFQKKRK